MHIHDPEHPELTDEAMARGEAVGFVPEVTEPMFPLVTTWHEGWTECGYTEEGGVFRANDHRD